MSLFSAFFCFITSSLTTFLIFLGILGVGLYGLSRFHNRVENTEKRRRLEANYDEKSKVILPAEELILDGVGLHWQQKGVQAARFDIAWNDIEQISFNFDPYIKYATNQKVEIPRIMNVHYDEIITLIEQNTKLGNPIEKRGLWGDHGERIANLQVTEDTPSKLILKMVESQAVRRSWRGLIAPAIGTTLFLICIVVMALTQAGWGILIALSLIAVLMLGIVIFSAWLRRIIAIEANVTIDLQSQRATRIEKFRSGKTKQYEIKLEQVSRVVIHSEELGHGCNLVLDSPNNLPFTVRTGSFVEIESVIALGRKLGDFLKKPVTVKWTDQGNLMSEETVQ